MEYKRLIKFAAVILLIFFGIGLISYFISSNNIWNYRALHFIIFQDVLFIIFSILPAMGSIFGSERVAIFIFHWSMIGIHTINGIVLIWTGKGLVDQQYFVSVACLVFIGCIFSSCIAIMLTVAYWTSDFDSIFDDQFINMDSRSNSHRPQRLTEDFLGDFENINTLIFKKYMNLNNKCWPIWLGDYQDGDTLKILPNWYHTFHTEWIKNWFRNQLKCPFWRVNIKREDIEKDRNMDESEIIDKIKASESVIDQEGIFWNIYLLVKYSLIY